MPKLWDDTIEAHRRTVRDAVLDAAASLVAERGLRAVTMSEIAGRTGIGRATLYRYFPDVDAMLLAWHERQVLAHLEHLRQVVERPGAAGDRLAAVLEAYALIRHASQHGHGSDADVAAVLHQGGHIAGAERAVAEFLRGLLAEAAQAGAVRDDVSPDELARFCLHALSAAGGLRSRAAASRLVKVTLDGLRAPG